MLKPILTLVLIGSFKKMRKVILYWRCPVLIHWKWGLVNLMILISHLMQWYKVLARLHLYLNHMSKAQRGDVAKANLALF